MTEAHPHEDEGPCEPGLKLYRQALLDGRLRAENAALAPCLVDLGLLHSTGRGPRLPGARRPHRRTPPLLRASEDHIANERRREQLLADTFESLMRIDGQRTAPSDNPVIGMNVRTVRVHIAKLAATPGSESRAQLGYLSG